MLNTWLTESPVKNCDMYWKDLIFKLFYANDLREDDLWPLQQTFSNAKRAV